MRTQNKLIFKFKSLVSKNTNHVRKQPVNVYANALKNKKNDNQSKKEQRKNHRFSYCRQ